MTGSILLLYNTFTPAIMFQGKNMSLKKTRLLFIISIILFCGLIFSARFFMLLKSSEPAGLDGYYYALQAKSMAERGSFENPDFKIGYYLCALFTSFTGDAVLGCKIWASLAGMLLSLSVFFFLYNWGCRKELAFAAFLLSGALHSCALLSVNYINNLTGLFFLFFYGSLLIRLIDSEFFSKSLAKWKKIFLIILTLLLFFCCVFSHLISAVLALAFTAAFLLKKLPVKFLGIVLGIVLIFAAVIFVTQKERFSSVFAFGPVLPLFSKTMRKGAGLVIVIEISIFFILCWIYEIYLLVKLFRKKSYNPLLLLIPVFFFPFWNLSLLDMGYRILLSAVPFGIIPVFIAADKILKVKKKTLYFISGILSVIFTAGICFSPAAYNEKKDPPYAYYRQIIEDINLEDDTLLIAHMPLNHVYTYYKNLRDCLNYLPEYEIESDKVWRLTYGVNINSFKNVLDDFDQRRIVKLDEKYCLLMESDWQDYLSAEDEMIVETYRNYFNPYTQRPSFVRAKNLLVRLFEFFSK